MASKKAVKSIEEIYQKKTPVEHILTRPDTYIGDVKNQKELLWIYDKDKNMLVEKEIEYVPGLYKIFDEIIVNAGDRVQEDSTCDIIKVSISKEDNTISVYNNGVGIDVVEHKDHKVYVPSLIFGELLTSTNYDDTKMRTTGGRNGYGAKLANIYSTFFSVETVDGNRKLKFYQEFKNNMSEKGQPKITALKADKPKTFTQITFKPDLIRFGLTQLTDSIISLFEKRVYDLAGVYPKITVYLNEKKISFGNFKKYIDFYNFNMITESELSDTKNSDSESKTKESKDNVIYEEVNDRWKIGVIYTPNNDFKQVSFVNGICTYHGGSHVDYVVNAIIDKIKIQINKKHKDLVIKPTAIKENIIVFINAVIENPAFTSQVKETLKTKTSEFGSTCDLSDKFIKKLCSTGIVDQVINLVKLKEQSLLKKTDGKKTTNIKGIPKLEDANWAGTKKSKLCKLILTEGDSAKAFALAGRAVVGSDMYGVFPLRGKLLNVREAKSSQIMNNEEIKNIKKIMGLQQGKVYTDQNELRYGGIIVLTDQDSDGFHIKGLLINFIHYFWPSLIKLNTFVFALQTPIVKATKGKEIKTFYNLSDYEDWKNTINTNIWRIKYYKGLGTSTKDEAKEYFEDIEQKLINYTYTNESGECDNIKIPDETLTETATATRTATVVDNEESEDDTFDISKITNITAKYKDETTEAVTLAFEKDRSNDRKIWLMKYDRKQIIAENIKEVPIKTFINRELIHFSNDDCNRSIPSVCDGLKPSQRKVLYGTFLKKLYSIKDEIRVSQLASYVSEKTCYHHGEASVIGTIVKMAQTFVGSNNINLLFPSGQFGTRLLGGEDAASARYIHTFLDVLAPLIFREEDNPVLNYLNDDGIQIEPEYFCPIIPMILVNGAKGIGSGFSCTIPQYSPKEIIQNIFAIMNNNTGKQLMPWYKGFNGSILNSNKDGSFLIYGKYQLLDDCTIKVTELPIGVWITDYKEFLETEIEKKNILSYTSNITDEVFDFTISMDDIKLEKMIKAKTIYQKLKLVSRISTNNMYLYSANGAIKKYRSPEDILSEFYDLRIDMYKRRKEYLIKKYENELNILAWKMKFIKFVLDGTIIVFKQKKDVIINKLKELKFPELATNKDSDDKESYEYITSLPLFSLTDEKVEELQEKINNKEEEIVKIKATSEIDQWKKELELLLEKYEEWNEIKPKEIKIKAVKKTTKATKKNVLVI